MTAAARVLQADVERAIRAAKAAGETIAGVDILPDGRVRILTGEPVSLAVAAPLSPLEQWERDQGNGPRAA